MIAARKRPEISRRRLREHDVDLRGAQAVDVIAARDRQRPRAGTAASASGARGCWRRRRRPRDRSRARACAVRIVQPPSRRSIADGAFGDELGPGRSGRVEQGQIEVAAGSDEERRRARAGGRQLDVDVSASVAEVAAGDDDSRNRPRSVRADGSRSRARALRPPPHGFSRGWLPSTMATRAPCVREEVGRPGAGGAAADHRDIEGGHGQAK